jgi:hypothetical protein
MMVQAIMVQMQRVTFTAVHQYLGLSTELMNRALDVDPNERFANISEEREEGTLIRIATQEFARVLGFGNDTALLEGNVKIREVPVRVMNATYRDQKLTRGPSLAHCEPVTLLISPDVG